MDVVKDNLTDLASEEEQRDVAALIIEELRRLHEGVLARYGLRPVKYQRWREGQRYL